MLASASQLQRGDFIFYLIPTQQSGDLTVGQVEGYDDDKVVAHRWAMVPGPTTWEHRVWEPVLEKWDEIPRGQVFGKVTLTEEFHLTEESRLNVKLLHVAD